MSRETGSTSVLTIGFLIFLGVLVVVVVDASSAFLDRQHLAATADGAAAVAADGIDRDLFYSAGPVRADPRAAADLARRYVAAVDPRAVVVAQVVDGQVQVSLRKRIALPFTPPGWPADTVIAATATSRLMATGSSP